ncbi:energy transducer TonB [Noviherbaspirillum saxi]|uniref:Energy transducer TonB n=1 Tax=Noviherbaspirillum saxi TaxID=2320863 RepID=A0A3A3FTF9_9BURK|nr:energy transducer TonB [Noviherbaspirillum saxi]RJF97778.1 energy transducer TonB [Noviherbaspirillum saxi]
MKLSFPQNRTLTIAIAASVLVHGALLAVRFAAPEAFKFKPTDPGLEVILVNAKHDRKPVKAEALAQANLDGGGQAEAGRSKSPLPDMRRSEDGDGMKSMQRRIDELERQQRMLAQMNKKSPLATAPTKDRTKPQAAPSRTEAADASESAKEIMRREAEIAKRIEDENKRPKKTFISPSTREVGYAMYFNSVRQKIEKLGTTNFPQKDGRKLYGELTLSISIFQDGSIYLKDKDDGVTVDRSSGNPTLDEAARRIVRRSAPFGAFAKNMRSGDKEDVWVMTTRFKFTRDNELEAELQGGRS